MTEKRPRGLIGPVNRAPNAEPKFMPEIPKKIVFGQTVNCEWCKNGRVKKTRKLCGVCHGTGLRTIGDGKT